MAVLPWLGLRPRPGTWVGGGGRSSAEGDPPVGLGRGMCPSNSLGTLAGEGEVGGEGAPLVKRGVRVCLVPLASPRAAGGRELTLTPCRPGDARGHVRPCRAGDTPPPSLWPASRPPSGGREGEPGSGGCRPARSPASRPFPPVLYRGRPGSPSTHPRVQGGKGTRPLSVTSTVQQWPGCTPSPARADGKPPGPGHVSLSAPRHPCSSGRGLMWPPQCQLLSICLCQQGASGR